MGPVNASGHLQHNIESLKESVSHPSHGFFLRSCNVYELSQQVKKAQREPICTQTLTINCNADTRTSASLSSSIGTRQHVMDDCCGWCDDVTAISEATIHSPFPMMSISQLGFVPMPCVPWRRGYSQQPEAYVAFTQLVVKMVLNVYTPTEVLLPFSVFWHAF